MFCLLFSLATAVVQKKYTSKYLILIKNLKKGKLWFRLKVQACSYYNFNHTQKQPK